MKHGSTMSTRGLMAPAQAINPPSQFEGKFGRMFPELAPAKFSEASLQNLAAKMTADGEDLKDGPDAEESGIPALYTYLGQFVDHDLTFDPASFEQTTQDANARIDFRTPAFDLDCVYGRGPDDQPYLYEDEKRLLTGDPLQGGNAGALDVPRNAPGRALIGDPRNDENAIVTQLQGLFLRHHNRLIAEQGLDFEGASRLVRLRYQRIVLNDFLPRIIDHSVLGQFRSHGRYLRHKLVFNKAFMPIEFSGAAYRLGHSMVRPGYRLNDQVNLSIFPVPGQPEGLTGFRRLNPQWGLDWARFIDIELRAYGTPGDPPASTPENLNRLQLAYRLDTSIVDPLSKLPQSVGGNMPSLIFRNLLRGMKLGLPSGQTIARELGVRVLEDSEIKIGKLAEGETPTPILEATGDSSFAGNCPLWTYVLAEAMHHVCPVDIPVAEERTVSIDTPRLGPVGGYIVASTFLSLMFNDRSSLLNADAAEQSEVPETYSLRDFVNYALGL